MLGGIMARTLSLVICGEITQILSAGGVAARQPWHGECAYGTGSAYGVSSGESGANENGPRGFWLRK